MPVQDCYILMSQLRDCCVLATSTALVTPGREDDQIHAQTVRIRLTDYGIRARHLYHGSRLTPPRRRYRAHWAHQHLRWTQNQWNTVLFSDESRFCLDRTDGRMKCYRRHGERYSDNCVLERDLVLGPSVMVWGAILFHGRSELNSHSRQFDMTQISRRDFGTCCGSIL